MEASEWLNIALLVTETLERLDVPYVIGGSVASIFHGMNRMTVDVDMLADLRQEHVASFVNALKDDFYVDEQSVRQAIERKGSFNLLHLTTMYKVDIFIPKNRPFDRQQLSRRLHEPVHGSPRTLAVLTAEDIILAKLDWFRMGGGTSERQWRDILGVIQTQRDRLDLAYLQKWAGLLGVGDLLERALAD